MFTQVQSESKQPLIFNLFSPVGLLIVSHPPFLKWQPEKVTQQSTSINCSTLMLHVGHDATSAPSITIFEKRRHYPSSWWPSPSPSISLRLPGLPFPYTMKEMIKFCNLRWDQADQFASSGYGGKLGECAPVDEAPEYCKNYFL